MKGVNDILNALFSSPTDKTLLSNGSGPVSPKGGQSNVASFEDILAQLASEEDGASQANGQTSTQLGQAPTTATGAGGAQPQGSFFESLTTFSEVDIRVSEEVRVANPGQLAQAEQSLVSLASGLAQLVNLFSNLQNMDATQAQNALASLSGGAIAPDEAKSFLASLQSMVQKLPEAQNPLLLSSDQQSALLNQMLQQMIQHQQILFGTAGLQPSKDSGLSVGEVTGTGSNTLQTSDVFLQVSFSDTQITRVQQTNTQSSQIFINLQTFQMAATFAQVGDNSTVQQNNGSTQNPIFQPVALPDTQALFSSLNQALLNQAPLTAGAVIAPAFSNPSASLTTTAQDALNQNFKNLVQMLIQAGVGQAVLTTVLNQPKDQPAVNPIQSLVQNGSMDQILKSLAPSAPIPPVSQTDNTTISSNDFGNKPFAASQAFIEQISARVSITSVETQVTSGEQVPTTPQSPVKPIIGSNNDIGNKTPVPQAFVEQISSQVSIASVEALTASAGQVPATPQPPVQPVIVSNTSSTQPQSALPVVAVSDQNQEPTNMGNAHAGQTAPVIGTVAQASSQASPALDTHILTVLNDTVARLNILTVQGVETHAAVTNGNGGSKPTISMEQLMDLLNQAAPTSSGLNVTSSKSNTVIFPSSIQAPPLQTSADLVRLSNGPETSPPVQPKVLENELAAINQFIQSQRVFSSQTPRPLTNISLPAAGPQNLVNVAALSQTQLIQTVSAAAQMGTVSLSSTTPQTSAIVSNVDLNNLPTGNAETLIAADVLTNAEVVTAGNNPTPVNQLTTGSNPPAPPPANNQVVPNAPQPISPVSITVQETVSPTSVDVQVKVANGIPLSASLNAPVPSGTTPATTIPVSTALNVPASVVSGEVVKVTPQAPATLKNADFTTPSSVNNLLTVSEVKPIDPQAVSAVVLGPNASTDVKISLDGSKNANNNPINVPLITLLPNPANLTPEKAGGTASATNQTNNSPVSKVDSFQILNQVTEQIAIHASEARTVSRMSFQLIPESLGRVTVQIALVDQALSARFIVSNPIVQDRLQHHLIELKTALNQSGLQIDQLQVQVQGGGANLLAQYYQYQQEGFGYRLPASLDPAVEEAKNAENTGILEAVSARKTLVDMLV